MGRLCDLAYNAFGEEARRRGIDYRRSFDTAPTIVSDGDRVLQIISNLLSNAFRWTPDGGRVELELAAENGTVSIAVDDTGPGISAARARADLPARSGRGTTPGPVSVSRSRASSPWLSAGGSSWTRDRAQGAGSSSCCPRGAPRSRSTIAACPTPERAAVVALPRRRGAATAAFVALRPRQWTKNLLLFAGIVFAAKVGDAGRWLDAFAAFVAYCAASSAAYLVNDVRDASHDRRIRSKRRVRSRAASVAPRRRTSSRRALAVAARACRCRSAWPSIVLLAAFLALQAAYTLRPEARRVDRRDDDLGAVRDARRCGRRGGARAHFAVAAAVHGVCSRSSSRLRSGAASSCSSVPTRRRDGRVLEGYSLALVDQLVSVVAASTVDRVLAVHVHGTRLEGADGDDPVRRLRRLPLPAADPPPRTSARSRRRFCCADRPILSAGGRCGRSAPATLLLVT